MSKFECTYINEHREKQISLPSTFTCALLPQQRGWYDNENSGVNQIRHNKRNKTIRMIA